MGIILILIGIIIQRAIFRSKKESKPEGFLDKSPLFIVNPIIRIILAIVSWIIIIGGIIYLFS